MNKKILIFGIGPLARTVYHLIQEINDIDVVGFIVDDEYHKEDYFLNLPLYKLSLVSKETEIIICIGYKSIRRRKNKFEELKVKGFNFVNIIHPSATISQSATIGENNIIFPQVCIEPNVKIENNNIIWSQSLVGHDAKIGSHNYISAKVLVGGNSSLKNACFLGNSTSMINDLEIEDETYLVAGSFLFNNTKEHTKYFGNPARKIAEHKEEGIEI
jgi:UDP-N-acetylbacillosamine N-acetyltransferase